MGQLNKEQQAQMVVRKANKVYPTMNTETFRECQATIEEIKDVETKKFGDKIVAVLSEGDEVFNVFLNNYSLEKLGEAYGEDDVNWKGKLVDLKLEKDENFNNDMIVLYPVK